MVKKNLNYFVWTMPNKKKKCISIENRGVSCYTPQNKSAKNTVTLVR